LKYGRTAKIFWPYVGQVDPLAEQQRTHGMPFLFSGVSVQQVFAQGKFLADVIIIGARKARDVLSESRANFRKIIYSFVESLSSGLHADTSFFVAMPHETK
jgi:hypothetical protein